MSNDANNPAGMYATGPSSVMQFTLPVGSTWECEIELDESLLVSIRDSIEKIEKKCQESIPINGGSLKPFGIEDMLETKLWLEHRIAFACSQLN